MSGWFDTIWADDLPSRAVTVYMYLRSRADREGKCFPSVRTISRDTKLSMSTVRRALEIWSMPDTYKSSPVGEPTGLKAVIFTFCKMG